MERLLLALVDRPAGAANEGIIMTMRITSPAFDNQKSIPSRFTCEGDDVSPPLSWTGVPERAQTLALIVEDPDAPDPAAPKRIFTHWLIYNLPPDSAGLPEQVGLEQLPNGARAGRNDFERREWGGPCPPIGEHRYFFKLYALDAPLPTARELDRAALYDAIEGHAVEYAEWMGTYQKQKRSGKR
jgi:Raf kinase inhibitor-like YbhB/YbcL family protein